MDLKQLLAWLQDCLRLLDRSNMPTSQEQLDEQPCRLAQSTRHMGSLPLFTLPAMSEQYQPKFSTIIQNSQEEEHQNKNQKVLVKLKDTHKFSIRRDFSEKQIHLPVKQLQSKRKPVKLQSTGPRMVERGVFLIKPQIKVQQSQRTRVRHTVQKQTVVVTRQKLPTIQPRQKKMFSLNTQRDRFLKNIKLAEGVKLLNAASSSNTRKRLFNNNRSKSLIH